MIVKVLLTFDFDPVTNTYKELKSEVVKDEIKVDPNEKPQLELFENKYHLNNAAMSVLHVTAGDRVDIRYKIIDGIEVPLIGNNEAWGDKNGNKITKSQTVSFRGSNNEQLSKYGSVFTLIDNGNGLFKLDGGIIPESSQVVKDENIEIPTDDSLVEDIIEEADFEEDIKEEDDSKYELSDVDFNF